MAGEFDPLGDNLYSIMGGIPGGGPMGAMSAAQMQQANLAEKQAQAALQQSQAGLAGATAERTRALIQPEVAKETSLGQLFGQQAGEAGARTTGLQLGNIGTAAKLPSDISAGVAENFAKADKATQSRILTALDPMMRGGMAFDALPPPMRANLVSTSLTQHGLADDATSKAFMEYFKQGGTLSDLQNSFVRSTPEVFGAEVRGAAEVQSAQQRRAGEVEAAKVRGEYSVQGQRIKQETTEAMARSGDQLLSVAQEHLKKIANGTEDPSMQGFYEAQAAMAQKLIQYEGTIKTYQAQLGINVGAAAGGRLQPNPPVLPQLNPGNPQAPAPQQQGPQGGSAGQPMSVQDATNLVRQAGNDPTKIQQYKQYWEQTYPGVPFPQ